MLTKTKYFLVAMMAIFFVAAPSAHAASSAAVRDYAYQVADAAFNRYESSMGMETVMELERGLDGSQGAGSSAATQLALSNILAQYCERMVGITEQAAWNVPAYQRALYRQDVRARLISRIEAYAWRRRIDPKLAISRLTGF